jgi:hypothetical protein
MVSFELILERPLEDVDDLFAGMRVLGRRCIGGDVDAVLNDLASGSAETLPLEIGSGDPGYLLLSHPLFLLRPDAFEPASL